MVIITGVLMILILAVVGINLSRGSVAPDPEPMPPPRLVIQRPTLSKADAHIIEREELRRHFLMKRPGVAR
jgi:hypothetical protein